MKFGDYETHPLADAIPLLEGEDLEAFEQDVKLRGFDDDRVTLYKGRILDGRDRYRTALKLGLEVQFVEYTGDDPLGLVISRWRHRKHHNATQRAMIATKLLTFVQGRPSKKKAGSTSGITQGAAAAAAGVSDRFLRAAADVRKSGIPELVAAAERGELAADAAAAIAKLPAEQQRERLQAELAPAPRRARNDNAGEKRGGPPPAQALMRVVRRAIEELGGTIKTLRPTDGHGAELLVAYGGQVFSISLATQVDAELSA